LIGVVNCVFFGGMADLKIGSPEYMVAIAKICKKNTIRVIAVDTQIFGLEYIMCGRYT